MKIQSRTATFVYLSAVLGILLINFFTNDIMDVITPFLMPFVGFALLVVYLVMIIAAIVIIISALILKIKQSIWIYLPAILTALVILAQFTVPFNEANARVNFMLLLPSREQVVHMIQNGEIKTKSEYDLVHLPLQYLMLSKGGGDVLVTREDGPLFIMFYIDRGFLDNYGTGIAYVDDESKLDKVDAFNNHNSFEKWADHWYYLR